MDFTNYTLQAVQELPGGVYDMCDELLWRIADTIGYNLDGPTPGVDGLRGMISAVAPWKELQQNKPLTQQVLGASWQAIAADWLEESGVLRPLKGALKAPAEISIPDKVDAIVIKAGVANWMRRRLEMVLRFDPRKVREVVVLTGNRVMKESEHQLIVTFVRRHGKLPTETDFALEYIDNIILEAGFDADIVSRETDKGDVIASALFEERHSLLDGRVLVIGNAPSVIQDAAQVLLAARQLYNGFDRREDQLFVASDAVALALHGELPATNQQVDSGLGALLRDAMYLQRAVQGT